MVSGIDHDFGHPTRRQGLGFDGQRGFAGIRATHHPGMAGMDFGIERQPVARVAELKKMRDVSGGPPIQQAANIIFDGLKLVYNSLALIAYPVAKFIFIELV